MTVRWCQPRVQSRPGAPPVACQAGFWIASAPRHTAVARRRQSPAAPGRGPGHHLPGVRGGQVNDRGVLQGAYELGHDPRGARDRLGRQLDLDGPDLPGIWAAREAGPVDLRVGYVADGVARAAGLQPAFGTPPGPPLLPGWPVGQPQPRRADPPDMR